MLKEINKKGFLLPKGNPTLRAKRLREFLKMNNYGAKSFKTERKKAAEFNVPLTVRRREELFRKFLEGRARNDE